MISQSLHHQRLSVAIQGVVQGVGFRPFIYRLAAELGLTGWVNNSAQGVLIEVEGNSSELVTFLHRMQREPPPRSSIQRLDYSVLDPIGYTCFEIRASFAGEKTAIVLPDMAPCSDCLNEIFDPANRRYRYPFTNCTNCGPRFSILEALPYDRPHTTMQPFIMCHHCQTEYENPGDRRFHAQPNACLHCGPHLELWHPPGEPLVAYDQALHGAGEAIRQGKIVAIQGVGGFHLIVDARNAAAVQRLRQAKHRLAKPFALLYPSLELVQAHCEVSGLEAQLLRSPEAPIVLLRQASVASASCCDAIPHTSVAPNNPYRGIMLPSTPLYHLLMQDLGFPVVATSGNLADEPICTDATAAMHRLGNIADYFLLHNRAIARPLDDSVVRVVMGQASMLRRGRGYAPLPIPLGRQEAGDRRQVLAVGGHLKNTIAFSLDQQVFVSQHLGDLDTVPAFEVFQQTIASFQQLYELQPTAIACDLHPDYRSTQYAHQLAEHLKIPLIPVQHHYAHVLSCMAEHQLQGSALGVAWDGAGYGGDGTLWGGEFLQITNTGCQRVAHLRSFPLPGGEKAVKEPRRSAIGLLYQLLGKDMWEIGRCEAMQTFSSQELEILKTMLNHQLNSPLTSSAGRLFDAIASLLGLRHYSQFEGQAAMDLEFAIREWETDEFYPFAILAAPQPAQPRVIDWATMVKAMLSDRQADLPISQLSAKFHNTLVEIIVAVAQQLGADAVVLTGGCFQNKYLTERTIQRLRAEGFQPYWQQHLPSHDGGLALGQVLAALRELSGGQESCV